MVREGTRSQTGNARPRVFQTVDTQPTIKRSKPIGAGRKSATTTAPAAAPKKTTGGVTKKAPAKKAGGVAGKAKVTANKVKKRAAGATRAVSKKPFGRSSA